MTSKIQLEDGVRIEYESVDAPECTSLLWIAIGKDGETIAVGDAIVDDKRFDNMNYCDIVMKDYQEKRSI